MRSALRLLPDLRFRAFAEFGVGFDEGGHIVFSVGLLIKFSINLGLVKANL